MRCLRGLIRLSLLGLSVGPLAAPAVHAQKVDPPRERRDTISSAGAVVLPFQVVVDTLWRLSDGRSLPRGLGASVGVLDSATIARSGAATLSELLTARVPGVSVMRSSGVVGAGSQVQLQGATSFFAPREPIVVLDGVRLDATQSAPGLASGSQRPSRLDDISLDEIARIDVLRGPAASALYGSDATGGVIRITTSRPWRGKPVWSAFAEGGASADATDYPANYSTGSGITDEPTCSRASASLGTCSPGPLLSWSPLEGASPFRTAQRAALGASVSGGRRRGGVLASVSARQERGVLAPNDATRYAGRLNVDADLLPSVRLGLRTSYTHSRLRLPFTEGVFANVLAAALSGNAVDDPTNRGYRAGEMPVSRDTPIDDRVRRAIGSLVLTWKPGRWLTVRASAGGESLRRDAAREGGIGSDSTRNDATGYQASFGRASRTSLDASVTASFKLASRLSSETVLGVERLATSGRSTDTLGVASRSEQLRRRSQSRVTGLVAWERLSWQDVRYLGFGVRHDRSGLTGFDPATFVSADAVWVVGDEPFFPKSFWMSHLRLRSAYGRSTDFRSYAFMPPGGIPQFPGAPTTLRLPGEHVSEIELGMDALLFRRIWLEATGYRQYSNDALTISGLFGFPGEPIGEWRTTGLDASVSADLVRSVGADWTLRLDASVLSNRLEDLGNGRSDLTVGSNPPFMPRVRFRNVPGYPIAGIWGNPIRVRDTNGNGIVTPDEVSVAPDLEFLGSSRPTRELALSSRLELRRATFNVLVDYRGGFKQLNVTELYRCEFQICEALYDPGATLADQARAVSAFQAGAAFVEDASFVRLREAGISWRLLPGWTYRHGIARLDLAVAAQNVFTMSRYSGFDPEVNSLGQAGLDRADFLALPLPRTVTVRLGMQR